MGEPLNSALKEAAPSPDDEWLNPDHPCLGVNRRAEHGRVELLTPDGTEPRRKFALIGFSSATRHLAPLADPAWAVVGMNQLQRHLRHAVPGPDGKAVQGKDGEPISMLRHGDLWFEIHGEWNTAVVPGTDYAQWLADFGQPIYMTDEVEGVETAVPFPIDRLIDKFGLDYYTSTVSYMIAWAIDHIDHLVAQRLDEIPRNGESATDVIRLVESIYAEYTIGVFGIDLIVGEEYAWQRPSAEFWIGQALARNIEVVIPEDSALLSQRYRYGYQVEPDDLLLESDFEARIGQLTEVGRRHGEKAAEMYGRLDELRNPPEDREARLEELEKLHHQEAHNALKSIGARKEAEWWAQMRQLRERGGKVR